LRIIEKKEKEGDRWVTRCHEGGRFEVKCVHCGQTESLRVSDPCESDPEEREYVGKEIFCIRGEFPPVFYKEEPMLCRGCGRAWMIDSLRLRRIQLD
jgi:hypothetical protein